MENTLFTLTTEIEMITGNGSRWQKVELKDCTIEMITGATPFHVICRTHLGSEDYIVHLNPSDPYLIEKDGDNAWDEVHYLINLNATKLEPQI